jgi:signal transduction histidine kinase
MSRRLPSTVGFLNQDHQTGGTGLGLPLVQQIVSAHNGTIAYTSEPAHGATFKVSLPIFAYI